MSAAATRSATVGYKAAAIIVWGLGAATTAKFFEQALPSYAASLLVSMVAQALMTFGEHPLWEGRFNPLSGFALVLDIFTNIGGLYFIVEAVEKTDSWLALSKGLRFNPDISDGATLLLSVGLGFVLAAAPEYLWKMK